jgi:CheY-like chemotaxis protein
VLRQLLEQVGFAVLEAANGREALDICTDQWPHLILMDLRMPVMDGYEAVKRIWNGECGIQNEDGRTGHPPIIAVTAHVRRTEGRRFSPRDSTM